MIAAVGAALLAATAAFWAIRPKENAPPPCGSYTECLALGRGLREAGKLKKAAVALDAAARLKPGDTTANVELANDYIAMGRYEAAKKCFARLRKEGGETLESYIREGYAGMNSGNNSEALAAFKKAIAQDPSKPDGYAHMGSYMYHHRRIKEAEKYFRIALERSAHNGVPANSCNSAPPLFFLIVAPFADLLIQSRRFAEAESLLHRELPRLSPCAAGLRSWFLVMLGDIDCAREKLSMAENYYRKALKDCGHAADCLMPYVSFAKCEAYHARGAKARQLAARAESLSFPNKEATATADPTASLTSMGQLYIQIGDLAGAERVFKRVISYYAHAPRSINLARALEDLANVRRLQGRMRNAESLLARALAIDEANGYTEDAKKVRRKLKSVRRASAPGRAQGPTQPRRISKKLLHQMQAQGYW